MILWRHRFSQKPTQLLSGFHALLFRFLLTFREHWLIEMSCEIVEWSIKIIMKLQRFWVHCDVFILLTGFNNQFRNYESLFFKEFVVRLLKVVFSKKQVTNRDLQAEVFYNVNYVNVNYSVKNSTVDCKYLLFLQDFFSSN